MRAAVLHTFGRPRLDDFPEPTQLEGCLVVDVLAAGVNHLDLLKASGTFFTGPPALPSVVGSDGVGRLQDGRRVYFDEPVAPFGSMAERTLVRDGCVFEVTEGIDDAVAGTLGNAGLAAWLSLTWQARVEAGETVLVLGATGVVGSIAVQVARLLGAGRVIAVGRDADRLQRCVALGADTAVSLLDHTDLVPVLRDAAPGGIDVTVDLLWGRPGLAALQAAASGARHVQLGHLADQALDLPATTLRSAPLTIAGYANFHVPRDVRRAAYLELTSLASRGEIAVDVERVALNDVADAWRRQAEGAAQKLVIIPHLQSP